MVRTTDTLTDATELVPVALATSRCLWFVFEARLRGAIAFCPWWLSGDSGTPRAHRRPDRGPELNRSMDSSSARLSADGRWRSTEDSPLNQDGCVPSGIHQAYIRYSKGLLRPIDVGDLANHVRRRCSGTRVHDEQCHVAHVTSSKTKPTSSPAPEQDRDGICGQEHHRRDGQRPVDTVRPALTDSGHGGPQVGGRQRPCPFSERVLASALRRSWSGSYLWNTLTPP